MLRGVIGTSAIIAGFVFCYLLFLVGALRLPAGIPTTPNDQTTSVSLYLNFVGVMLTALTVFLAAMAIGIGIIAAYTFTELKKEATSVAKEESNNVSERIAKATANEVAREALSDLNIKRIVEMYFGMTKSNAEWDAGPEEDR